MLKVVKKMFFCVENKIASGVDFKTIVIQFKKTQNPKENSKIIQLNPLGGILPKGAMIKPNKSEIEDYQTIFKTIKNNKP